MLIKMEENAITNQLVLFVQRVISLRIPVELPEGVYVCVSCSVCFILHTMCVFVDEEEQRQFVSDLETFIGRLLRVVEVDLSIDPTKVANVHDQIHGNNNIFSMH